jgi:uncharacterized lipoprotein YehR (DUF1307 family)
MTKFARIFLGVLLLAGMVSVAACGKKEDSSGATGSSSSDTQTGTTGNTTTTQ